jgi:hypothetical protein
MKQRVIQISIQISIQIPGPHPQLDIDRSKISDEATNRLEGECMKVRLRRETIPLAHEAGHQLAVIALSLFFVPIHIVTALYIGDGFSLRSGSNFKPFL